MTEKTRIARARISGEGTPSNGKNLWVYGYEMIPPHPEHRMATIREILDRENEEAKRAARNWTARLVTEQTATHVLIVSASPELDLEVNRKLEAQLRALGVKFRVSVPMSAREGTELGEPAPGDQGDGTELYVA